MACEIIETNDGVKVSANRVNLMIESEADLNDEKAQAAATGSVAYNAELTLMFHKGIGGVWKKIGG